MSSNKKKYIEIITNIIEHDSCNLLNDEKLRTALLIGKGIAKMADLELEIRRISIEIRETSKWAFKNNE